MTRRRLLLSLVALAAYPALFGLSCSTDAQELASPRHIEVLLVARSPEDKEWQAFRQGLSDAGYSEGHNLVIEWRFSSGDYARVPDLIRELVQRRVEVLVVDT